MGVTGTSGRILTEHERGGSVTLPEAAPGHIPTHPQGATRSEPTHPERSVTRGWQRTWAPVPLGQRLPLPLPARRTPTRLCAPERPAPCQIKAGRMEAVQFS